MTQEITENKFEVGNAPKLIVKNISGKIIITPNDENTINIKAIKYVDRGDFKNTIINIEETTDGSIKAEVKFDYVDLLMIKQPSKVDFIIEAPQNTTVQVDAISSSVDITGLQESIQVKTISGEIGISDCSGNLKLKSISGAIIGNGITGQADLNTISGRIKILESNFSEIKSSTISGDMKVETQSVGDGPYNFKTISGKLFFIIPPKTGCHLRVSRLSGQFKTDLIPTNGTIRSNKWKIDLEGGGTEIVFSSISGDLHLLTSENGKDETLTTNSIKPKKILTF